MELVYLKRYPDAETYKGTAYFSSLTGSSLRTGLPPLDDLYRQMAISIIEWQVGLKGGSMIETKIYREDSSWQGIPTYNWDVQFNFYFPGAQAAAIPVAVILAIINAILAAIIVIGVFLSLSQLKEVVWGPKEMPWWTRMIIPLAIAAVAITYAYSKFIKRKK